MFQGLLAVIVCMQDLFLLLDGCWINDLIWLENKVKMMVDPFWKRLSLALCILGNLNWARRALK